MVSAVPGWFPPNLTFAGSHHDERISFPKHTPTISPENLLNRTLPPRVDRVEWVTIFDDFPRGKPTAGPEQPQRRGAY